jgi:hypothetical protein
VIRDNFRLLRLALPAVLFLGLAAAPALAVPILVHQSTERFYSMGGTSVTGCMGLGCPQVDFTLGDASGTVVWRVQQTAFRDTDAGTFSISYQLFNDSFAAAIASSHVHNGGILADSGTAPVGWSFSQDSQVYSWMTSDVSAGVPAPGSLASMQVTFSTANVGLGFHQAAFDFINASGNRVTIASTDWAMAMLSPTPEPGTLLLLASGLVGLGYLSRRGRWGRG